MTFIFDVFVKGTHLHSAEGDAGPYGHYQAVYDTKKDRVVLTFFGVSNLTHKRIKKDARHLLRYLSYVHQMRKVKIVVNTIHFDGTRT